MSRVCERVWMSWRPLTSPLPAFTCAQSAWGGVIYGRNSAELKKNGCQTKYACLRSSGVTAALRTLSPGLGPPPRLETEWIVLQSREEETLEDLPPNEEEAEVLGGSGVLQGPMMVLMTTRKIIY